MGLKFSKLSYESKWLISISWSWWNLPWHVITNTWALWTSTSIKSPIWPIGSYIVEKTVNFDINKSVEFYVNSNINAADWKLEFYIDWTIDTWWWYNTTKSWTDTGSYYQSSLLPSWEHTFKWIMNIYSGNRPSVYIDEINFTP